MELTRENYYEKEPIILKDIETCEFIAFDLEFSGIIPSKFKIYDSPEENFQKSKYMAETYRIIQVGITPFIKKENNPKEYIAKPYNIYAFPSEKQCNNRFDFFLESIIFNREHGCDFNKWISHGVPYLNNESLKKITERAMTGNINKYDPKNICIFKNIVLYKEQDKIRYKNFLDKFNIFFNNPEEKIFKHEKIVRHLVLYFLNKLDEDIRNRIFIEYKEEMNGNGEQKSYIIIHKLNSLEEKKQRINQENNEIITTIKREKGIKNIIEKIISSKKPIVGHNCFIDLLFIMSHFMDDIPKTFKNFKLILKNEFSGGIYDTKHLYNSSNFNFASNNDETKIKNNINLECLYNELYNENQKLENDKKLIIEIPEKEEFVDYLNQKNKEKKFHQADYDSFTTGCAFVFMKNMLGEKFIKEQENKLNCYHGIYSFFDLNNLEKEEKYINNSTDAFILLFNEKFQENNEIIKNITEEVINSKYINCKIKAKEIGGSIIVFINSENKNDFIQACGKFKDYINVQTISEYKELLKNKINNK